MPRKKPKSSTMSLVQPKPRYGFVFSCPDCGWRCNVGGVEDKRQFDRIVKSAQQTHSKQGCRSKRKSLQRSMHAAELAHTFVEQTTRQTTTSTTYGDISGASISSASFTTGKKYLIFITAQVDTSNVAGLQYIQTLHGTTAFADSECAMENNTTASRYTYQWWTVWTAVSGEGIKLQGKVESGTAGYDMMTMTAIKLSDDLTENTDWYHNEVAANTTLASTASTTNNATITFTPGTASHRWLILSKCRIGPGIEGATSVISEIVRTGEASSNTPIAQCEGEDGTNDRYILTLMRSDTLGAASNTYKETARYDGIAAVPVRTHSGIFALDLDKLRNATVNYEDATQEDIPTTVDYAHNIHTASITPDVAGDVWILGAVTVDWGGTGLYGKVRMQVDNSDQPPGQTTKAYQLMDSWDTTDQNPIFYSTVENLSAAAHTIDLDGSMEATGASRGTHLRSIMAVTMELPAGAGGLALVKVVNESISIAESVNRDLYDDFEQGSTYSLADNTDSPDNKWHCHYTGNGTVDVRTSDSSRRLYEKPQVSTTEFETHAALVTSNSSVKNLEIELDMKTIAQTRQNFPANNWETAWVMAYVDDFHHYYFTLKASGWELGKKDNDQSAEEQWFLATGLSPSANIGGTPQHVELKVDGDLITVTVDGVQLVQVRDDGVTVTNQVNGNTVYVPPQSGTLAGNKKAGLYNEDAEVTFDNVRLQSLAQPAYAHKRTVPEAVQISESVIAVIGRSKISPTESVEIDEATGKVLGATTLADETENISENIVRISHTVQNAPESVEIAEQAQKNMAISRNVGEAVQASESTNKALGAIRNVNETVQASEQTTKTLAQARNVSESMQVEETVITILGGMREGAESINIDESVNFIAGVNRIVPSDITLRLSGGASNTDPNSALGGAISGTEVVNNVINNLWDNIGPAEAEGGESEYRCVYIRNAHGTHSMDATEIWVSLDTPAADDIEIGLGTSAINGTEQTIADENTAPIGVTFSHADGEENAILVGNIPPEQHAAIWIKRTVSPAAPQHVDNSYQLMIQCLTNYG